MKSIYDIDLSPMDGQISWQCKETSFELSRKAHGFWRLPSITWIWWWYHQGHHW